MMQTFVSQPLTLPLPPRGDRSIPLKSDSHFSGHLVFHRKCSMGAGQFPGQILEVESHLEMNIALILAMRPQVADLECQVRFDWRCRDTEKSKRHFFDFRATLSDGSRVAVMVKQSKKLSCPKFCAVRDSVTAAMRADFSDRVVVLTERNISPVELYNASFLDGLKDTDPEADAAVRRSMHEVQGDRAIGEIVRNVGLAGRGFRAVGRLLRQGELELARLERITEGAVVRRKAG